MVQRTRYPIPGIILMPRGNGLLGEQHQEVLAMFQRLDPTLKRYMMSQNALRLADSNLFDTYQINGLPPTARL